MNTSALLTTLIAVTNELSSYLLFLSHLHGSPIGFSLLFPCVSAILSLPLFPNFLLAPLRFSLPLIGSLLFLVRYKAVPPLVYKALCWVLKALSLT